MNRHTMSSTGRRFGAALLAVSMGLGSAGLAQAQPRDRDHGGPRVSESRDGASRWDGRRDDRGPRHDRDGRPGPRHGWDDRRGPPPGHAPGWHRGPPPPPVARGWHPGPPHRPPQFVRGGHLPPQYRHHNYVVSNWRGHHLSPPPRGYHWVQADGRYVLAAIATGLILQVLLNP